MTQEQTDPDERARVTKILLAEIDRWKIAEASDNHDAMIGCGYAIGALSNVLCRVLGLQESITVEVDGVVRGRYPNAEKMAWHFGELLKSHDAMRKELDELRGVVNL